MKIFKNNMSDMIVNDNIINKNNNDNNVNNDNNNNVDNDNNNVDNDNNVDEQEFDIEEMEGFIRMMNFLIIYRTVILIVFSVLDFVFSNFTGCDYGLSVFLVVDGILCIIRMLCSLYFLATKSVTYVFIDKILYNFATILWVLVGLIYGSVNTFCEREIQSNTFKYFWASVGLTLFYRLIICILPTCVGFISARKNKNKIKNVLKYFNKLDFFKFIEGKLVNSKGETVKVIEKEDDKCLICLTDYDEDANDIVKFDCGHHFHKECSKLWISKNPKCPACKKEIC